MVVACAAQANYPNERRSLDESDAFQSRPVSRGPGDIVIDRRDAAQYHVWHAIRLPAFGVYSCCVGVCLLVEFRRDARRLPMETRDTRRRKISLIRCRKERVSWLVCAADWKNKTLRVWCAMSSALIHPQRLRTHKNCWLPWDCHLMAPEEKNAQLVPGNGNPAWSLVGHSASLSRRSVSPVNPRVIVHTPTDSHLVATPGFLAVAFVRGEGFAEIITHDDERDELSFFLFKYDYPCENPPYCTMEERYSAQCRSPIGVAILCTVMRIWRIRLWIVLQCHQSGLRGSPSNRRSLLMFQLNSMWMHWMYDNRHFFDWTDNPNGPGPFHEMMQQYVKAHATPDEALGETYAGIPNGAVYGSRPKSLESLIEGNGFGNGFDDTAYAPNGSSIGLLQDYRGLGIFFQFEGDERYALNLNGHMIMPPSADIDPFDYKKLNALIQDYSDYRNGVTTEFPNVLDLFPTKQLHRVGLRVQTRSQCTRDSGPSMQSVSSRRFEPRH